ncbi:hypothetical protein [Undibacterium rugosum]|uniref:Uncharacterized protein n=1 Tax=Undibacterium rugosum TaxID=2762291 RepID=A0A923I2E2_9BURK|nr:hypothetical protein [Undibacterium rugosum]MBC3935807.1 hypothetical protein [Undibacterium rugosum]MBR7780238.1 hypothetical protein [Undibacterium rugosum]
MKAMITGMKGSKGNLENGQAYDSTKVYVQTRLDDSKGNAKGFAIAEYNFGDSSNFDKFKHLPFPFNAEVEYENITSGRATKTVIIGIQPLQVAKPDAKV